MRNFISGITYLLVGCSVILLILIIFVNFKEKVWDNFVPDELSKAEKSSEETENPADNQPDTAQETTLYALPPSNSNSNSNVNVEDAVVYDGKLELPVNGATGYASVDVDVFNNDLTVIYTTLKPGKGFRILNEYETWWQIYVKADPETGGTEDIIGWVRHNLCMINLPDVIPSIIYNNTNAYKSVFRANEEVIPEITGEQLYSYSDRKDGVIFNERLQKNEYIVPVLYAMAERICQAQRKAQANGDTLVIYEGFRPLETQNRVYNAVLNLPYSQKNFGSYDMIWFIARGKANHQMGYAIDTSLAQIVETKYSVAGKYKYPQFDRYIEYNMPCQIHELSVMATLANARDNIYAQGLQKYCNDAGLSSIPSEWWHFNDEYAHAGITKESGGDYFITECFSVAP